ncbi:MAG: hypothetical protein H7126_06415 [Candidatus Parcubacteria bacterium]|uniref:hypothetical protein n=1 Tax=Phormidesmis priestleyi TaxID=268141 RepID=UPI00083A7CF8|nr:hypothetical protein [Phormidesmis priestleyi]MBC7823499.1 hypothetical protein [Leptolyngbyaceae cyanobacterium LF-bin-113]
MAEAELKLNVPVETTDSVLVVKVDPAAPLSNGVHRFQLVVVDDSGNESDPAIVEVIVRDTQRPTAVIDAPPNTETGQSFKLSGERSSDVAPGKVVKYIWTMVPIIERPPIRPVPPFNPPTIPVPIRPPIQ